MSGRTTRPVLRPDSGEPARTGAAEQPQQKRFGLILHAVPYRNRLGFQTIGSRLEKRVAGGARSILEGPAFGSSQSSHVGAVNLDRQVERRGQRRGRSVRRRPPPRPAACG